MRVEQSGPDVLVWIKAVPGAARNQIAGPLGDRLKIRITAPPQDGRANNAICKLMASALDKKARDVTIESGHGSAEKTVRILNASSEAVMHALLGD